MIEVGAKPVPMKIGGQEIEGPRGHSEHNRNEIRPVGTFTHDSEVVDSIAIEVSRRERYRKSPAGQ